MISRAAIRYAKAILDTATTKGVTQDVNNDMLLITSTIEKNENLKDFIQNPTIKTDLKINVISEVFATTHKVTKSLFHLLSTNNRFKLLYQIALEYRLMTSKLNGLEVVHVTTAFSITPQLITKVLDKIKEFSNKTITVENIVDPSIIGGFILKIGDKQFNASVADKLQLLKREFNN